jgi:hypothetical protein
MGMASVSDHLAEAKKALLAAYRELPTVAKQKKLGTIIGKLEMLQLELIREDA